MERRSFLKLVGTAGATSLATCTRVEALDPTELETAGILVDLTACEGCRMCEYMCAEANDLPEPDDDVELPSEVIRKASDKQWTVVNGFETSKGVVYAKRGCMHCTEPACAAACLTKALVKTKEGPVIWRADKCMGCRYCMVSCPFDAPKFEYNSAVPRIQKCRMR